MIEIRIFHILFLYILCILPACSIFRYEKIEAESDKANIIYNIEDSVKIIRALIEKNKIYTILEDANTEQIEILLNNFSPAEIAFESEVLSCVLPVFIYFYNKNDTSHKEITENLESIAKKYDDKIKIVSIDTEKFYVLSKKVEVEETPSMFFVKNRNINFLSIDNPLSEYEIEKAINDEHVV